MRITALLSTLLVVACSSSAPTTNRYLLRSEAPIGTSRLDPPVWIALNRVEVAPYLGEPGLVVETQPHQVRPARYHIWAEPLADGLRRFLAAEISNALGFPVGTDAARQRDWDRTVDVSIDRLHGTLSGEALLVARWWIAPQAGKGEAFQFSASEPLPREGYAGLVYAEVALARQLARAIAESLRGDSGP